MGVIYDMMDQMYIRNKALYLQYIIELILGDNYDIFLQSTIILTYED